MATTLHDPRSSSLFVPWTEPASGVTSYLLNARVAPVQQTFYFTNPSWTDDGRHFWFYCAYPPEGHARDGRTLGVVDFLTDRLHWFPDTSFTEASPAVDLSTGRVFWSTPDAVWQRPADPDAARLLVARFPPPELAARGQVWRTATHFTFSADGRELNIDAHIGSEYYVGSLPLDGRPFELWQQMDRYYNHAQFSPTDPDLLMVAQDDWDHPQTGEPWHFDNRIWLLRRGQRARPLFPNPPRIGHEWWDPDGRHIWYLYFSGTGTQKVEVATGKITVVWPDGRGHSHASAAGDLVAGDNPLRDADNQTRAFRVSFFNAATGREALIAATVPVLAVDKYHAHPHPRFCGQDRWIAYTTTVRGQIDVAFTEVAALLAATA